MPGVDESSPVLTAPPSLGYRQRMQKHDLRANRENTLSPLPFTEARWTLRVEGMEQALQNKKMAPPTVLVTAAGTMLPST